MMKRVQNMRNDGVIVNGWDGITHDEMHNVVMGFRISPRLMQFMYNRFDNMLTITETTRFQLQDTKHYIDIDWTEAKQILEGWI